MIVLLLAMVALSAEVVDRPLPPVVSAPHQAQCQREVAVVAGEPVVGFLGDDGLALCSGILVPTSRAADLLLWEAYARQLETFSDWQADRWRLDVAQRDRDLLWTRARIDQLEEPPPWFATPAAYKWGARAEMLAIVGATVAVFAIGYEVARAD